MQDLIDITQYPSMPAMLSTEEPGEAWIWGDFFAVLQVRPKTMAHALQHLTKQPTHSLPPMEYPFAMSVFYRLPKNPHGPSQRPVLVATLERLNYAAAAAQFGGNAAALKELGLGGDDAPAVKGVFNARMRLNMGVFNARMRLNMGDFDAPLTADNARAYFFDLIRQHLHLSGEPVRIGTIADVYGHPETGWPVKQKRKAGFGCLVGLALLGGMAIAACLVLMGVL